MIKLDRDYNSVGVISAGSGIYVFDSSVGTNGAYVLLVPTSDMPAGAGAPDTIDNPLLTVSRNGQVEGKQSVQQKEYTYNWNRDNNRRLKKFSEGQQSFLERDGMEFTGNLFNGTLTFDKDAFADNELMAGKLYITVTEDIGYADDIRDLVVPTAVITSALPKVTITGTNSVTMGITTSSGNDDTVTAVSEKTAVATATYDATTKKLTITGVKAGTAIVKLTCSNTTAGEGSSERTVMVEVL